MLGEPASHPFVDARQRRTDRCPQAHRGTETRGNCTGSVKGVWRWTARQAAARETRSRYLSRMIDWSSCAAVEQDPERYSGAWLFRDTRVPVAALFENLEDDAQVQDFLDWFPGVTREQVRAVLEHAARSALSAA